MNIDELVDCIVEKCNNDYSLLIKIMISCADLTSPHLPPIGIDGTKVARQYWVEQSIPASKIEDARIDCWNYLDERSASTNTEVPEYCAVRAVICVLYADPPSDDFGELASFFIKMLQVALSFESEEIFTESVFHAMESFYDL